MDRQVGTGISIKKARRKPGFFLSEIRCRGCPAMFCAEGRVPSVAAGTARPVIVCGGLPASPRVSDYALRRGSGPVNGCGHCPPTDVYPAGEAGKLFQLRDGQFDGAVGAAAGRENRLEPAQGLVEVNRYPFVHRKGKAPSGRTGLLAFVTALRGKSL